MKRLIAIFLVGLVFLSFGSQARWDKLWDKEVGIVVVDQNLLDGTTRLFATDKTTGDLYKYGGTPNSWTKVSGPGQSFVSTGEGLYRLYSSAIIYRYIGPGDNWEVLPGGTFLKIYGGGNILYATKSPNGDIYMLSGNVFKKIGGKAKTFVAGGCLNCWGDTGGELYKIDTDGVWRYPGRQGYTWEKIGGPTSLIYAGSSSSSVYSTDPIHGDIYRYKDDSGNTWEPIGGPGKMWAIDIIGKASNQGLETLYGLSGDGNQIWRWEGQPEEWTQIDTAGLNTPLKNIYAGGGQLYVVANAGRLWKYVP